MDPQTAETFRFCYFVGQSMQLCIFEDHKITNFFPLVYCRPVYALRCGATELREKIERLLPKAAVTYHCRPELTDYVRETNPRKLVNEFAEDPTWFINGRVLVDGELRRLLKSSPKSDIAYFKDGSVVAAKVGSDFIRHSREKLVGGLLEEPLFQTLPGEDVDATLLEYPWELIHRNGEEIQNDFAAHRKKGKATSVKVGAGVHLVKKTDIVIGRGTVVKPGVVLDAETGPIMIGENVTIHPNAVIQGPVFIGSNSIIKISAKVYGNTSIGPSCKIGGEIDASIFQSHANKQHDGFLGHSYICSWVNIGADTNNSDLKNNYGTVKVMVNGSAVDSGLQFVGLFMGDHAKTGINVMFDTGTVVGVSCNIYGAGYPPKYIPSFSWGSAASVLSVHKFEKSLETAQRVMGRRDVKWTEAYERLFRHVFDATVPERARARIF